LKGLITYINYTSQSKEVNTENKMDNSII